MFTYEFGSLLDKGIIIDISPKQTNQYQISPIGYVENEHDQPKPVPKFRYSESRIVLFPEYVEGLTGLDVSEHVMVLFYFNRADSYKLMQHPRGDRNRPKRGVFALCSPYRPNHIGVTVVELISIQGNVLHVRGLDALNGTPVIDLKPA